MDTSCLLTSTSVPCGMYPLTDTHAHTHTTFKYLFRKKLARSGIYSNSHFPRVSSRSEAQECSVFGNAWLLRLFFCSLCLPNGTTAWF